MLALSRTSGMPAISSAWCRLVELVHEAGPGEPESVPSIEVTHSPNHPAE